MLNVLETIYQGDSLSFEQANASFQELLLGKVEPSIIAALLVALKTKGESIEEIAGAANALREKAQHFPTSKYPTTDCCGTGGDGFNTINVSTISAFVAASLGVKIVKHGNRSVSSQCGSSDLIGALNINTHLSPKDSKRLLDDANFCFLMAPDYHPGVKHVMPIRQSLKTRTIFNLIGPLSNPARPEFQLLGVYDKGYCEPFAKILSILGTKKAMVVNGSGLDEIAVHDNTQVAFLEDGEVNCINITPEDMGLQYHSIESLQVGGIDENIDAALAVINGNGKEAHTDIVAANTGAVLYLNGVAESLVDAVQLAKQKILSGDVAAHVEYIRNSSNV